MPQAASTAPDIRDFDAAKAAEDIAMNHAMPVIAAMKAGALALKLKSLPATTSQADRIMAIVDGPEPDLNELRDALLEQCRELNAARQRHTSRNSQETLGDFADRCLDLAVECGRVTTGDG